MEIITLFGEGNSSKTYELTLKHPTPRTDEWACVGEDPELFHPEDLTQLAEAQQVCADCPMRQTCLDAIAEGQRLRGRSRRRLRCSGR